MGEMINLVDRAMRLDQKIWFQVLVHPEQLCDPGQATFIPHRVRGVKGLTT